MSQERIAELAQIILAELEYAGNYDNRFAAPQLVRKIRNEPFTAAVTIHEKKLEGEGERLITYFVGRHDITGKTKCSDGKYVRYMSPIGHMFSLPPGATTDIVRPSGLRGAPEDYTVEILDSTNLTPKHEEYWDGIRATCQVEDTKKYIQSLRAIVDELSGHELEVIEEGRLDDLLDSVFQSVDEKASKGCRFRFSHEILDRMELRDTPILDQHQDSIFRSPLRSQIIIAGAPGTGKTTTLIKRIAQKTNVESLEAVDQLHHEEAQAVSQQVIDGDWTIFIPNDILRNYLKEALNKEGLTATNQTVVEWGHARNVLARDTLKIIGPSKLFGLPEEVSSKATNLDIIRSAALIDKTIWEKNLSEVSSMIKSMQGILEKTTKAKETADVQKAYGVKKRQLDELLYYCESVLSCVPEKIKSYGDLFKIANNYRILSLVDGEKDRSAYSFSKKIAQASGKTITDIVQAFLILAEKSVRKKSKDLVQDFHSDDELKSYLVNERERINKVKESIQNLGGSTDSLDSDKLVKRIAEFVGEGVAESYRLGIAIRFFTNRFLALSKDMFAEEYWIQAIPHRYKSVKAAAFKRGKAAMKAVCVPPGEVTTISVHELDILVFLMLKYSRTALASLSGEVRSSFLKKVQRQYRKLVAVDEATDFSSVQIGAMYYLSSPDYNAFTLTGDLMQRATGYGLTDWDELKVVCPFKKQELELCYRQNENLFAAAAQLYESIIGEPLSAKPLEAISDCPSPLLCNIDDIDQTTGWIRDRILEIYESCDDTLPSIAVFTANSDLVEIVGQSLAEHMKPLGFEVEACHDCRTLGLESRIRVFNIDCIKGLEFEAAFIVDVDTLEELSGDLFDKYLYVALTRVSSYLGVTYKTRLPDALSKLSGHFSYGDWSGVGNQ